MDKVVGKNRRGSGFSGIVLKVMGLFVGLQSFNIICSIIKFKLMAIWLQASGIGLYGILSSASETISIFTDMGLRQSAVRDVAANGNNPSHLALVSTVVRRWGAISGLLGAVVVSALSPALSMWFFHSYSAWWQFALLSFSLFMNAVAGGETAIMQGTSRLRQIARAGLLTSAGGLLLSVPVFYFGGDNGIVFTIIIYSVCGLLSVFYYRSVPQKKTTVDRTTLWREGRGFIRLGIFMSISAFSYNILNLLFMAFLNYGADNVQTGFYQAGQTVVIRYAGLVFTAVSMEFYPRLVANIKNPLRVRTFVSHEITILQFLIAPVVLVFLLCRGMVIELLYSSEFAPIITFVSLGVVASVFKAVSWTLAYAVISSGRGKLFFLMEITDSIIGISLLMSFYSVWGFDGLGYAFILWYLFYACLTYYIYTRRLHFSISRRTLYISVAVLCICLMAFAVVETLPVLAQWMLVTPIAVCFIIPLRRMLKKRGRV